MAEYLQPFENKLTVEENKTYFQYEIEWWISLLIFQKEKIWENIWFEVFRIIKQNLEKRELLKREMNNPCDPVVIRCF